MSSSGRAWLRAALFFAALTVAATWPQAVQPGSVPPHQDSWLNMWRIAWVAHQVPRDPRHLFDANIHYPERATLAYSDAILLQGLLASPLIWLGLPTPHVHTVLVLASFVFAAIGAWALVRRLTGSSHAGLVAGLIFAFTPYRFDHYMHMELLWTGWMPLTLLALHEAIERGTLKAGLATGLLFAAQALSCIYYSVLFGIVLVGFCGVLAFGLSRPALRRAAISLGLGGLVAGLLILAYLTPYRQARAVVGERSPGEALLYSAGPKHYLSATPQNLLYGGFADRLGRHEKRLFPGLVAVALATVALWPPLTRRRTAYLVALLLAIDLSFGPAGLTYNWLRDLVLPFRGIRALARSGGVALLMVAVLAGYGWARLERSGRLRWRSRLAVAGVLAAMAIEYAEKPRALIPAPTRPEPVYEWLAEQRDQGPVVEFPLPELPQDDPLAARRAPGEDERKHLPQDGPLVTRRPPREDEREHLPQDGPLVTRRPPREDERSLPRYDPEFMYRSTFHWHPLVNGYSGYVPSSYIDVLRAMRTFPSDVAIERLRGVGVRYIIVHERLFGSASYRAVTAALDVRPDVVRHGPFGPAGEESTVYALPARAVHD